MKTLLHLNQSCALSKMMAAVIFGLVCQTPANASTLEFDFSNAGVFSGAGPAAVNDANPYAKAIFNDAINPGFVTLTMSVLSGIIIDPKAYVNDWYFNLADTLSSTNLSFAWDSGDKFKTMDTTTDKVTAGAQFDFAFHFDPKNPGDISQGYSSVYKIALSGINVNSFNVIDNREFHSAVHVQGYGASAYVADGTCVPTPANNNCQTPNPDPLPVPVPEPASIALLAIGLLGFGTMPKRKIA